MARKKRYYKSKSKFSYTVKIKSYESFELSDAMAWIEKCSQGNHKHRCDKSNHIFQFDNLDDAFKFKMRFDIAD